MIQPLAVWPDLHFRFLSCSADLSFISDNFVVLGYGLDPCYGSLAGFSLQPAPHSCGQRLEGDLLFDLDNRSVAIH